MEVIFIEALSQNRRYTYEDYLSWPEDERWEIIDGVAHMLAAPNVAHQSISFELCGQIRDYLKGKSCRAFAAPFSVRLDDDTVVEPDISVICDMSKLDNGKACVGAPDMIVEIMSPSASSREKVVKFNKYLQAGVREYWVVYPDSKSVSVYLLKDGWYVASEYADTDTVPVVVLAGCTIRLPDVFSGL